MLPERSSGPQNHHRAHASGAQRWQIARHQRHRHEYRRHTGKYRRVPVARFRDQTVLHARDHYRGRNARCNPGTSRDSVDALPPTHQIAERRPDGRRVPFGSLLPERSLPPRAGTAASLAPEAMADHDHTRSTGAVLADIEGAAHFHARAEQLDVIRRHRVAGGQIVEDNWWIAPGEVLRNGDHALVTSG